MSSVNWIIVNSFGKLKFSKTSYYYLVLVPVLVKALKLIKSPVAFFLGENQVQIVLELPFNWYYFYFGAMFIALASLIYELYCPQLIKDFKTYGDFLSSGQSDDYLVNISKKFNTIKFMDFVDEPPFLPNLDSKGNLISGLELSESGFFVRKNSPALYNENLKYQNQRKTFFNKMYDELKYKRKVIMWFSFLFYLIGFSFFLKVILENFLFIIEYLFYPGN